MLHVPVILNRLMRPFEGTSLKELFGDDLMPPYVQQFPRGVRSRKICSLAWSSRYIRGSTWRLRRAPLLADNAVLKNQFIQGKIMKICLPVVEENGLQSTIAQNFGTAPWLAIVDTETHELDAINTADGACRSKPIEIDMVICRGVGSAMFQRLLSQGIRVLGTNAKTVGEALTALEEDRLQEIEMGVCGCNAAEKSACAKAASTSGCDGGCACS